METKVFYVKNLTNALIYVNTNLFTLLHCYMFQPSRGNPLGVLIRFVSRVILQEMCVRVGDSRMCRPVTVWRQYVNE